MSDPSTKSLEWYSNTSNYNNLSIRENHNNISAHLIPSIKPDYLIAMLTTIFVPLVFSIIVIVGTIGNVLVILVVATNHQMRNTTNVLILNLAVADFLFITLCVPSTATDYILNSWPFGLTWCQAVQYMIYVTSYVSIYTLILMSLDRFLAVVYPVVSLPFRTVENAVMAIITTWIIISTASSPIWFSHHLQIKPNADLRDSNTTLSENLNDADRDKYWCRFSTEDYSIRGFYISFFVAGFAIPLALISILYLLLLKRLWNPAIGHTNLSKESLRNKKRVTKLVLIVIVVFAVCWAPIQLVLILKALDLFVTNGPEDYHRIIIQILAHVLAYLNGCINPILYAFLSDNFRKAFYELLPRYFSTDSQRRRARGLNYELTTTRSANRSEYRHRRQKKRLPTDYLPEEYPALGNGNNANKSDENLIKGEKKKKSCYPLCSRCSNREWSPGDRRSC
ncbi:ASTA-R [Lepeophtheirus salmonis]|uniref:ASTA-R n=1 Tax=Lepeophtheirus salmonis TaxID=72036 RepID=A0A7R8GYV2_LEPSM|nr:ASTA-R [Lepeophtheirus salmonis]CAF2754214.1 ASTA-R [Lepeophtheirus salmonis]